MATITKIGLHHFGGLANAPQSSTQGLTEQHIENAHRARWEGFTSLLNGSHIGYNVIFWPDGWKQYRYIGEETAGAKGHNFDCFHSALAGNFMKGIDIPTVRQLEDQALVIRALIEGKPESIGLKVLPGTKINISAFDIYPHRLLAPKGYTQCNGDYFDDNFGRRIALNYLAEKYGGTPISQYIKLLVNYFTPKPLGGMDRDDEGIL